MKILQETPVYLDTWSEIQGLLTATERIDGLHYLLIDCSKIIRISVNTVLEKKARTMIGSNIRVCKIDKGYKLTQLKKVNERNRDEKLHYNHQEVGSLFRNKEQGGIRLDFIPMNRIPKEDIIFNWLKRKLHETGFNFKIYENGEITILIPWNHKYHYIIAWISRTYFNAYSTNGT